MGILTYASLSNAKNSMFKTPASEFTGVVLAVATGLLFSYIPILSIAFAPILLIALYNMIGAGIREATDSHNKQTHHNEMIFGIGLFAGSLLAAFFPIIGIPLFCWGIYKSLPSNRNFEGQFPGAGPDAYTKQPHKSTYSEDFSHNPNPPKATHNANEETQDDGFTQVPVMT